MTSGPERQVDDRLADWVDGTLTGRERDRFLAELRVNAQLRQDLADYERTVATIRSALQAPTQPTNLADRVFAAIAADRALADARRANGWWGRLTGGEGLPRLRSRGFLFAVATAAALLAVAVVLNNWSPPPATSLVARGDAPEEQRAKDLEENEALTRLLAKSQAGNEPAERPGDAEERRAAAAPVQPTAGEKEKGDDDAAGAVKKAEAERLQADVKPQQEEALRIVRRAGAPPAPTATPRDEAQPENVLPETTADRVDSDRFGALPPAAPKALPDAGMVPGDVRMRGAASGSRDGAAKPPGIKEVTPQPSGSDPSAAAAKAPAADLLALVVLQGDATDGVDAHVASTKGADTKRSGEVKAGGVRDAKERDLEERDNKDGDTKARDTKDKSSGGAHAALSLEEFLTDQMRVAATVRRDVAAPASIGRVILRAVEESTGAVGGGGGPESLGAKTRELSVGLSSPEAVERTWLVEGSQDDVAALLRNIAAFAKKRNLLVSNGEQSVVLPASVVDAVRQETIEPKAPPTGAALTGTSSGTSRVATPTRILLRFRLLRR